MDKHIAHYELLARIGAGGMGEVYRARDTRLERTVALKFLPDEFAGDRERLARFQREAQVLGSLQHPNIATLYGLEESEGRPFLVMELAQGESLEARIGRGAMPREEAMAVGLQVAAALEEAHERGVIHRDLKPGNVHVDGNGTVKVLDFGLAKALESGTADGTAGAITQSPTITQMTAVGVILGTAAYMSPEQAKGKTADRRADIWAFGVLLLEMLTGRRVFEGESISETLASILKDAVPLDRLPPDTPPALRALLARCLERDPKRRLQAIGEVRIALETIASGTSSSRSVAGVVAADDAAPGPAWTRWVPWAAGVLGLTVGVLTLFSAWGRAPAPARTPLLKFTLTSGTIDDLGNRSAVISPDGRRVVYGHDRGLWIRDLSSLEPRLLVDARDSAPEEASAGPAWSPDSRQIAYIAAGRLLRIAADGGTSTVIATVGNGATGFSWLADDRIAYSTARGDLLAVPARGGDPTVLLARDPGRDIDFHGPWELPGGKGILYVLHRKEGADTIEVVTGGRRKHLLTVPRTETSVVQVINTVCYAPSGHLVYMREQGDRGVWAVPFSLASLEVTGEPFLVAAFGREPSVSGDGTLLYLPGREDTPRRLVRVSPKGEVVQTIADGIRGLSSPSLSPDGTRVAYEADEDGAGEIWILNLVDGSRARLTFTAFDEGAPTWIPGQNRVAFVTRKEGRPDISAKAADGSGEVTLLVEDGERPVFSPDGRWMIFQRSGGTDAELMRVSMDGASGPEEILSGTGTNLYSPAISADGRYLSYLSWERGNPTTYIRPFPDGDGKWELPGSMESQVVWLKDRIVYSTDRQGWGMMEVPLSPAGVLSLGTPRRLFDYAPAKLLRFGGFDVTADGRRFVMVQDTDQGIALDHLVVVQNWMAEFTGNPAR